MYISEVLRRESNSFFYNMANKKILLIRNTPYDADFSTYNIQEVGLGKAFCRLGYDYDHICFKKKNQKTWSFYDKDGCLGRYIEVPRTRFLRWGINTDIIKKDFLSQYDIVISREYYQIMTYLFAKNHKNVSQYNGPYWNMFMIKWFSPLYDLFVTSKMNKHLKCSFVKSGMSKEFLEAKGYKNVINVGVGLDMERFDNESVIKPETQEIIDFMTENKCLFFVGNLNANKNLPFMLELFTELLKEEPDLKFVLVGKSTISAMKKLMGKKDEDYAIEQFAKLPEHVRANIRHIKRVENTQLKFLYPLAKAFLLPSKLEIFGMVLAEAMYLGAPVVTSRNGGSTSLIEGRNTGIVCDKFDVNLWKQAVLKLINDPDYSSQIVTNAKNLIETEFTWDAIAKKMISEIEKANTEL